MVGRVPGPEGGHHGRGGAALLEGPGVAGQGLGDRYPFIAEVKGSSKPICPEWFVVTSNYILPQLTDAVNRPSFFSAMKRRAEDGRRVISMETLGAYRPKRMGPQLKEYERKAYEEVFQLFVKLVLGEFSVCCIMFFESQPCCCRCTMNGAEAHPLRTHATRSDAKRRRDPSRIASAMRHSR